MREELTKEDIRRIEEEIEHRKLVVRKETIEAVKEARAQGDLSENFEYYAAKREKNQNEGRIRYLERMLRTARVIEENRRSGVVGVNTRVRVLIIEEDEEEEYALVTSIRSNSRKNLISRESALGKALFGHRIGDEVTVEVSETYSYRVRILAVEAEEDVGQHALKRF
ncbi:MAG: transcription elongation factor GreA [Lachnospiraceae bacterium]|nr:transcription elongation factor GreA [Lachnospiraceae bacterium]MDY5741928.1 transcription elongation factor GreA [Lachnospiraceae bacterium]